MRRLGMGYGLSQRIHRSSSQSWGAYWNPTSAIVENASPTNVVITYSKKVQAVDVANFMIPGIQCNSINLDVTKKIATLVLNSAPIYGDELSLVTVSGGNLYFTPITNNITPDTDAAAYFARMVVQPSMGIKRALNRAFVRHKTAGTYALTDNYCRYYLHTEQASLLDIKSDARNHEAVGSPTWVKYSGYTIVNNSYIRSHFIPSSNGTNFTLNDCGIINDLVKSAGDNVYDEGVSDGTAQITLGYGTILGQYNQLNSLSAFTAYNWPSGFNIFARTANNQILVANNGIEYTYSKNSVALPTKEFFIGAFNNNGSAVNFNIGDLKKSFGFTSSMDVTKRNNFRLIEIDCYNEVLQAGTVADAVAADTSMTERYDGKLNNSLVLYNSLGFDKRIPGGKFEFNTTNQNILIRAQNTIYSVYPQWSEVSVFENDVYKQTVMLINSNEKAIALSAGNKKVSLVESMLSSATSSELDVIGTFLTSVKASNFTKVSEGNVTEKNVFLGDSITVGGNSPIPETQGYSFLFRIENNKSINVYAIGNITLKNFAETIPKITRTVNNIVSMLSYATTNKYVFIAIGTNDWGVDSTASATFLGWYSNLLDAIYVAIPTVKIWCLSPILRTDGKENAVLDDYRTGIGTLCTARSTYTTHIAGKTILVAGDLGDGLHPTTAGQKKLKDAIYAIMYP